MTVAQGSQLIIMQASCDCVTVNLLATSPTNPFAMLTEMQLMLGADTIFELNLKKAHSIAV